jgi:hypothetical protein
MEFPDPSKLPALTSGKSRQQKALVKKLKSLNHRELDKVFHTLHEEAFETMDCLSCANCCKTTSPVFTEKDIQRIARHLRMRPSEFTETYLRLDEEEDYVLQSSPCAFLLDDNTCMVYEVRPKACRGWLPKYRSCGHAQAAEPHTAQHGCLSGSIWHLAATGGTVCLTNSSLISSIQ